MNEPSAQPDEGRPLTAAKLVALSVLWLLFGCTPIRTAAPYSAVFQGQMRPQPAYAYYPPPMYYPPVYQQPYRPVPMTCVNLGGVVLKCH
jgi:hypothetical protein